MGSQIWSKSVQLAHVYNLCADPRFLTYWPGAEAFLLRSPRICTNTNKDALCPLRSRCKAFSCSSLQRRSSYVSISTMASKAPPDHDSLNNIPQNRRNSIMASLREGDHQAAMRAAPWLFGTTQSRPNIDSSCVARRVLMACSSNSQVCQPSPMVNCTPPTGSVGSPFMA